jgi:hypothetical protein
MPTTYAIPDGRVAMSATTYTGNGTNGTAISNAVNGVSMQPDFVWIKDRVTANYNVLMDSVRGASNTLFSNATLAEETTPARISSFNSNGFTLTNKNDSNTNGDTFIAWQWKANGAAVTNTAGSITSQVSANTTAGFSVVTYTGTGANATVGHGLGVAPSMIIVKNRNAVISNPAWPVYHISIGNTKYLDIQTTAAQATAITVWNNTTPTSNVFSIGVADSVSGNTNGLVAYCFAAVPGYSAFGSYTGNGSSDGPFVYTNFRPRFVMIKLASGAGGNWIMVDTSRDTYNLSINKLGANVADAENGANVGNSTQNTLDILSNGFKIRATQTDTNGNGNTYVYMAFAETPFAYSNAR